MIMYSKAEWIPDGRSETLDDCTLFYPQIDGILYVENNVGEKHVYVQRVRKKRRKEMTDRRIF